MVEAQRRRPSAFQAHDHALYPRLKGLTQFQRRRPAIHRIQSVALLIERDVATGQRLSFRAAGYQAKQHALAAWLRAGTEAHQSWASGGIFEIERRPPRCTRHSPISACLKESKFSL